MDKPIKEILAFVYHELTSTTTQVLFNYRIQVVLDAENKLKSLISTILDGLVMEEQTLLTERELRAIEQYEEQEAATLENIYKSGFNEAVRELNSKLSTIQSAMKEETTY